MNKKRQAIFDKSSGLCWYCGFELKDGWHMDHFYPIKRSSIYWMSKDVKDSLGADYCDHPELDIESNKVPSCPSCNLLKSQLSIEEFRKRISGFIKSLNTHTNQYKFAKKYGLVKETDDTVVFWFEKDRGDTC